MVAEEVVQAGETVAAVAVEVVEVVEAVAAVVAVAEATIVTPEHPIPILKWKLST